LSDPKRLVDGDATAEELSLLRAARLDHAPPEVLARALSAAGLAVPSTPPSAPRGGSPGSRGEAFFRGLGFGKVVGLASIVVVAAAGAWLATRADRSPPEASPSAVGSALPSPRSDPPVTPAASPRAEPSPPARRVREHRAQRTARPCRERRADPRPWHAGPAPDCPRAAWMMLGRAASAMAIVEPARARAA
jgi:hypothetical protein